MAHIRLTVQKPGETEAHDVILDEEFSNDDKGTESADVSERLFQESVEENSKLNSTSPTLSPRRDSSSSESVSTHGYRAQQRKFSFPTSLPSNFLGFESTGLSARRRLSNVSDAVTRKLSSTIGWKTGQKQCQEIVIVGKILCSQYIRSRLKRSGYLNKKCGLQRVRSAFSLGGVVFREVYPELLGLGVELERLHPKVYVNITRQATSYPGGRLTSEKDVGTILTAISRELLKNELTWGKIVSLYAVAGALAVDCVKQGHYEYLTRIPDTMEEILEDDIAQWIQYKGGWYALATMVRPPTSKWPSAKILIFILSFIVFTGFIVYVFSLFGISAFL